MNRNDQLNRATPGSRRLYYLGELSDYQVHSDDPDVRRWEIFAGHQRIGRVEDLVADTVQNRVRYLDVEILDDLYRQGPYHSIYDDQTRSDAGLNHTQSSYQSSGENPHMLVPIGLVRIDEDKRCLYLEGHGWENLRQTPRHRRGEMITPLYEIDVYNAVQPSVSGNTQPSYNRDQYRDRSSLDDDFYTSPYFGGYGTTIPK